MDGTERRFEPRRFLTRHDVEDAHAAGTPVRLSGRDVLTHEAAQRARDLGVTVERASHDGWAGAGAAAPAAAAPTAAAVTTDDLRRAVRAAVIAELGTEPAQLDAVIERVLRARG